MFVLPFRRVHESCGTEVQMVVTKSSADGQWEGYCPSCRGTVFGTLYPYSDHSKATGLAKSERNGQLHARTAVTVKLAV